MNEPTTTSSVTFRTTNSSVVSISSSVVTTTNKTVTTGSSGSNSSSSRRPTPTILTDDDSPNSVQPVLFCLGSPKSVSTPSSSPAFQSNSPVTPNTPINPSSASTISTMFASASGANIGPIISPTTSPVGGASTNSTIAPGQSSSSGSGSSGRKQSTSGLSMDRAAFLLIRIKRAFQKKKRNKIQEKQELQNATKQKPKPPMLRARTLPTIIPPALHLIHSHWNKNSSNYQNLCNQAQPSHELNNNNDGSLSGTRSPELLLSKDGASSGGVSPRHSVSSNSSTSSQKDSNKKNSFAKLTRLLSNNPGHKISAHLTTGGGNASGGSSTSSGTSGMFWQRTHQLNVTGCGQDANSEASCFFWNHKSSSSKMKRTGSVDSLLSAHQFNLNSRNSCGSGTGEISGSEYSTCPPGCSCGNGTCGNSGAIYYDHNNYLLGSANQGDQLFCYTDQQQQQQIQSPTTQNYYFQTGPSSVGRTARHSGAASIGPFAPSHKPYGKSSLTGPGTIGLYNFSQDPKSSTYYLPSDNMMPFSGVGQHSFYGNRPGKIPATICSGKRQMSIDVNSVGIEGWKKSDRKKFEKLSKFNFDQQALFSAVENENFDRTRMIIETTDVDINSTNSDGFTPLDISLMLLDMPLIKYLQSNGAREADSFMSRSSRESHLGSLLNEAEHCVIDLNICHRQTANGTGGLSSALLKEKERQLVFWERRLRLLQRLKKGFDILEPPPPPLSVHVEIVGGQSLLVHYFPPIRLQDKRNIITKYKIEWSDNNFESVCRGGSVLITDLAARHEFVISNLRSEQCYNVRIASGNCKGFSDYCYPLINQASPSTWRSIDNKQSNISERLLEIDNLFRQIIQSRQIMTETDHKGKLTIDADNLASSSFGAGSSLSATVYQQKRMRKSIKSFFGAANKFQKVMKRGVYFASLVYHDERVLVTNDEVLPIIEIDDIYPSSLQNDFNWLLKISCTWEDAKMFRKDMEKSQSSSVAHFRTRILLAVEQMQSSLGLHDLGKLYYKPLRDSEGTVVFCAIKCLADPKTISCLSLRWLPLAKLQKRHQAQQQLLLLQQQQQQANSREMFSERVSDSGISVTGFDSSPRLIGDILLSTLDEMIEYHKACNNELPRGLYIGYVKLKSSLEMMSVMVAKSHPNILPYAKIRDNPHVSRQEWAAMKMCLRTLPTSGGSLSSGTGTPFRSFMPTSASQLHLATLTQAAAAASAVPTTSTTTTTGNESLSPSPQLGVITRSSLYGSHLNVSSSANCSPTPPSLANPSSTVPTPQTQLANFFQLAQGTSPNSGSSRCSSSFSCNSSQTQPPAQPHSSRLSFTEKLSFQQLLKFLQMLTQTAGHFLQSIGVTDADHCDLHRLYSLEVIELSKDVSFILLLPPPDEVCSIFNQTDSIQVPNLIYLPLKIFELIHMNTYQKNFTSRYSRISALLELDIMVAQQAQREAFSSSEVTTAKARVSQLQEFQTQLDECCRSMRWIMDVVAYARDRQLTVGVSLNDVQQTLHLMDKEILEAEDSDERLFHNIPAISLSTPAAAVIREGHYGQKINIESECNSTPTSPPPTMDLSSAGSLLVNNPDSSLIGTGTMPCLMRRKSRDDSYLEEHHRLQNHFNTAQHHRFHHQYGLNGSCGSSAACHKLYQNHSDSIDSNETANSQSQSLLSYVTVTNASQTPPTIVATSGSISGGSACMSPTKSTKQSEFESKEAEEFEFELEFDSDSKIDPNLNSNLETSAICHPTYEKDSPVDFGETVVADSGCVGGGYTSKSSYSLLDSVNFMVPAGNRSSSNHRESLTVVDKAALEDMRRCVSASKLLPSYGHISSGSMISSSSAGLSLDTVTKSNLSPSPEMPEYDVAEEDKPNQPSYGYGLKRTEPSPTDNTTLSQFSGRKDSNNDSTIMVMGQCAASQRGNYFFGHDMDMYDNDVLTIQRTAESSGHFHRPHHDQLSVSNQSIDTSLSDISISGLGRSSNNAFHNQLSGSQLSVNSVQLLPLDESSLGSNLNLNLTPPPLLSPFGPPSSVSPSCSRVPEMYDSYRPLSRCAAMLFSSEKINDLIEEEEEEYHQTNVDQYEQQHNKAPTTKPAQTDAEHRSQSTSMLNESTATSLNPFLVSSPISTSPTTGQPSSHSFIICDSFVSSNGTNQVCTLSSSLAENTGHHTQRQTTLPDGDPVSSSLFSLNTPTPTVFKSGTAATFATPTNRFNDNFEDLLYDRTKQLIELNTCCTDLVWNSVGCQQNQQQQQQQQQTPQLQTGTKSSAGNWSRFDSDQEAEPNTNNLKTLQGQCCPRCRCSCKGNKKEDAAGVETASIREIGDKKEPDVATTEETNDDDDENDEVNDASELIGLTKPNALAPSPAHDLGQSTSRIIDIYTAYECSVPIGTVLKLRITNQTVAGEIIETVVQYFNGLAARERARDRRRGHRQEHQHRHFLHRNLCPRPSSHTSPLGLGFSSCFANKNSELQIAISSSESSILREPVPGAVSSISSSKVVPTHYSRRDLHRFSLLAVFASNIKQLNWNFPVMNLQSPWNEARFCVKFNIEDQFERGYCTNERSGTGKTDKQTCNSVLASSTPPIVTSASNTGSSSTGSTGSSDCSCSSSECSTGNTP